MLNDLHLAFRNLSRYRTRTVVTIVAVLVSVFVSVVVDGFIRGVFNMSTYNLLATESAEVSVYADGYFERRDEYPSDILIGPDSRARIEEVLGSASYAYAPRYKTLADIVFYDEDEDMEFDMNVVLVGVDEDRDGDVFDIRSHVSEGEWLHDGAEGVVVGSGFSRKMGLGVGSYVTISTIGREGFAETFEQEVVGIVNTENPQVNSSEMFISLSVLDGYLLLDEAVSEIEVSDGSLSVAPSTFASKIDGLLSGIPVTAWYYEDVNDDLMAIMRGDQGSSYLILFFLFIIAAAGISNTMIMAAMERRKETAMLRALGFSRGGVARLFVYEGLVTGIIGAVVGTVLSFCILVPIARHGIDLTSILSDGMDLGYRVPLVMKPGLYWQSFVVIPCLAVLLSGLSAFLPVFRAGRKGIAELMRSV